MPELPEVETVCRGLRPVLVGRRLVTAVIRIKSLRRVLPGDLFAPLLGRRIVAVERRAKYVMIKFEDDLFIVAHLGMTGSFRLGASDAPYEKHEHVAWNLDDGRSLRFHDPRRFGSIDVVAIEPETGAPDGLPPLGPEPLSRDFNAGTLLAATRGRDGAVKAFLLDQRRVAGIGNIYASEALHLAGIRPRRAAGRLTRDDCGRLAAAVKNVLRRAIRSGGTTLRDYRLLDGSTGLFKVKLFVYDRAGERCRRCDRATIKRIVIGGRSTFYCPACQR